MKPASTDILRKQAVERERALIRAYDLAVQGVARSIADIETQLIAEGYLYVMTALRRRSDRRALRRLCVVADAAALKEACQ